MIGCSEQQKEKIYSLAMQKTEDTNAAVYERVNNLLVEVVNEQIRIDIPSSIAIPRGGCSMPVAIQIPNQPYQDVMITLE